MSCWFVAGSQTHIHEDMGSVCMAFHFLHNLEKQVKLRLTTTSRAKNYLVKLGGWGGWGGWGSWGGWGGWGGLGDWVGLD